MYLFLYLNTFLKYLTFSNTLSVSTFMFQDQMQCLPNRLASLQLHPTVLITDEST